jgi:hypothetical protein
MTGDQSRLLKVRNRVAWANSATDRGTVTATDWSGVTITWDDKHVSAIRHNDMGPLTQVKD